MKKQFIIITLLVSFCLMVANPSNANDTLKIKPGKKAKNIILLIGDGMGVTQIYSAILVNKGLNIERFPFIGFSKTYSANNYVTDSGAGGTAISTGKKTKNYSIGVDSSGNPVKSILEIAEEYGMHTGLVSTSAITHATPASFIAHVSNRASTEEIASYFLKTDIEVFIGGGKEDFSKKTNNRDLIQELKDKGYQVTDSIEQVQKITGGKLAGFTSVSHNPSILEGRGDILKRATETAIHILNQGPKGFFLMVEGSQIDWGGHDNDAKRIIAEVIDFDEAIGKALDFAIKDGNTLVIVTADHETGGMTIDSGNIRTNEFTYGFSQKNHTGVMVPVFAFGPGAENFTGIFQNTDIFYKMLKSLKIKEKKFQKK